VAWSSSMMVAWVSSPRAETQATKRKSDETPVEILHFMIAFRSLVSGLEFNRIY
jgi:hypothetical protein